MIVINFAIAVGISLSVLIVCAFPHTKLWESLFTFEATTTIEDILEENERNER